MAEPECAKCGDTGEVIDDSIEGFVVGTSCPECQRRAFEETDENMRIVKTEGQARFERGLPEDPGYAWIQRVPDRDGWLLCCQFGKVRCWNPGESFWFETACDTAEDLRRSADKWDALAMPLEWSLEMLEKVVTVYQKNQKESASPLTPEKDPSPPDMQTIIFVLEKWAQNEPLLNHLKINNCNQDTARYMRYRDILAKSLVNFLKTGYPVDSTNISDFLDKWAKQEGFLEAIRTFRLEGRYENLRDSLAKTIITFLKRNTPEGSKSEPNPETDPEKHALLSSQVDIAVEVFARFQKRLAYPLEFGAIGSVLNSFQTILKNGATGEEFDSKFLMRDAIRLEISKTMEMLPKEAEYDKARSVLGHILVYIDNSGKRTVRSFPVAELARVIAENGLHVKWKIEGEHWGYEAFYPILNLKQATGWEFVQKLLQIDHLEDHMVTVMVDKVLIDSQAEHIEAFMTDKTIYFQIEPPRTRPTSKIVPRQLWRLQIL